MLPKIPKHLMIKQHIQLQTLQTDQVYNLEQIDIKTKNKRKLN